MGGLNTFAYVNNDPVNWVDPWGLTSFCEALQKIRCTPNSFTDGSDLYVNEIGQETAFLESLDIPINVDNVDLQYFLLLYNMTDSSDRLTGAAATIGVIDYSLIFSAITSYRDNLSLDIYLDDVAQDIRGILLGYEAGLIGLDTFAKERCDE